ncbi:MAG: zf-HC2 domain-containing protein, partial [Clostridia bacterium]|nr:zf-HC2 domain-containing protein [Clostridia bacterium]
MMRCPDEGRWQAWIDGEVDAVEGAVLSAHFRGCADCREAAGRLRELTERQDRALRARLQAVRGGGFDAPSAHRGAWEAVLSRLAAARAETAGAGVATADAGLAAAARAALPGGVKPGPETPAEDPRAGTRRAWRRAWTAAAAAVVLAGVLLVPPVRSAAAGLLSAFRVERLAVVPVGPQTMARIRQALQERGVTTIDLREYGDIEVTGREVRSNPPAEELAQLGFPPLPTRLGDAALVSTHLESRAEVRVALKVAAINRLLARLGSEERLPESADGRTVRVTVPAQLNAIYGSAVAGGARAPITVTMVRAPEVAMPEGIDVDQARRALLSLPFLPYEVRQQLEAIDDWGRTAVVPVPTNRAERVNLDGVEAWLFSPSQDWTVVTWLEDGVITALQGEG